MNGSPLHIALHAGEVVRHDAASTSLMGKLRLLGQLAARGAPVAVTALVASTDSVGPGIEVVPRVWDRITAPSFRRADLHVWEYGTWYAGFDAVFVTSGRAVNMAICHGVTSLEQAPDEATRALVQRSLVRRHGLSLMHHVACHREHDLEDLLELGLDPARLSLVAPTPGPPDAGQPVHDADPARPAGFLRAVEAALRTAAVDVPSWVHEGAA